MELLLLLFAAFYNFKHNFDQFVNFHALSSKILICIVMRAAAEEAKEKGRMGKIFLFPIAELHQRQSMKNQ